MCRGNSRECFPGTLAEDRERSEDDTSANFLPNPVGRRCRDCGHNFMTYLKQTGSKWTNLCSYCVRQHT